MTGRAMRHAYWRAVRRRRDSGVWLRGWMVMGGDNAL